MVAKLFKKQYYYYCSNCMMRQEGIPQNCHFCGDMFSNYEDVILKEHAEDFVKHLKKEGETHEENLCR